MDVAVDTRGERRWRASFTAWQGCAHLLLGEGTDGCADADPGAPDPLERAADELAAHLAFHPRIFSPLRERMLEGRELSFAALEALRSAVHPYASLYATAIACTLAWSEPLELMAARVHSPDERAPDLRVEQATLSERARGSRALPPPADPGAGSLDPPRKTENGRDAGPLT